MSARRWAASLLLISAALLAFELLLMRLLALAYWGHFAGLVISIAMLGIASSGLLLFALRRRIAAAPEGHFAVSAGVFGLAAPIAFLLSQHLPFTPFLLTWSPREYALLAGRALLFFVPFFAAGLAIGIPFLARVLPMDRLYFWNMLGSGLPALPMLFAMNFTHPMRLLLPITAVALAGAILCLRGMATRLAWAAAGLGAIVAVLFTPFRYSPYKELPKTLLLPEARILEERYGWDGVVQIAESPHTRYLPGLSLNFAGTLPPSLLVFTDAATMTLVPQPDAALASPDFLRMTPEALSFALTTSPSVLHLYGGATDLLRARALGAREVCMVDDSETRVDAVRSLIGNELGALFQRAEARQFLEQDRVPRDVIAVSLLGTHGTSTAGAASLDPSFLLTVDGTSRIFQRLSGGGHAVVSAWVENPARSGMRLIALWIETLRRHGIADPSPHLMALRGWSTLAIFIGREPFDAAQVQALKSFCEEHSFDLVWFHGIDPAITNQINVIPEDPYYEAFAALLGAEREQFIARSPFALDPPQSDRPFFNQYFRWAALPQWISTMGLSWLPFVEWGYLLQVAALAVVTLLGLLLLIVPCMATRSRPRLRSALLFFILGVAYMFVQIWAILKLSQLVAHPLLASALVLSAMLIASGAGAAMLTRQQRRKTGGVLLSLCAAIAGAILLFPFLLEFFYGQATWLRAVVGIVWLVAPAFFMGFPFPNALAQLARESEIPWALALNGFGSVLGALLATLLAVHFGLLALGCMAVGLYGVVALLSARTAGESDCQR